MSVVGLVDVQVTAFAGCEETARRFYGELLDLPEIPKPPALAARGRAWFAPGAPQVHQPKRAPHRRGPTTSRMYGPGAAKSNLGLIRPPRPRVDILPDGALTWVVGPAGETDYTSLRGFRTGLTEAGSAVAQIRVDRGETSCVGLARVATYARLIHQTSWVGDNGGGERAQTDAHVRIIAHRLAGARVGLCISNRPMTTRADCWSDGSKAPSPC
jgi:hypothetical protein